VVQEAGVVVVFGELIQFESITIFLVFWEGEGGETSELVV